jgi:hypothetical protein
MLFAYADLVHIDLKKVSLFVCHSSWSWSNSTQNISCNFLIWQHAGIILLVDYFTAINIPEFIWISI